MGNTAPGGGCALPAVHADPTSGPDKHPRLTTHSSAGWPVASSHAPLAFSRTPSRSAPATASPSGRNEAGPLLARDGRNRPSPLPTSEQGLSLSLRSTVLPAAPSSSRGWGTLLASSKNKGPGCAGVAAMLPWRSKVFLFGWSSVLSMSPCPHVPMSQGHGDHSPSVPALPFESQLLDLGAKQNWI